MRLLQVKGLRTIFGKKGKSVDATYLTIVRLMSLAISLVCIKLASVNFSLDEYGTYTQAILIISTVTSFTILGMTDGINYYYNNVNLTPQDRQRYISTIFNFQLLIGILGGIVILCSSQCLTQFFDNPKLRGVYIWIFAQPLVTNLIHMLENVYISSGKTTIIISRILIFSLLRLGIFIIACYVSKSIITILALSFIIDAITVVYFVAYLKKNQLNIFKSFDSTVLKSILKFCIPMALFVLVNAFMRDADKWIVGKLGNTDEIAIYANSSRVLPFDLLTTSFSAILTPVLTRYIHSSKQKAVELFGKYLNFGLFTTLVMIAPAIILSEELMITLYSSRYIVGLRVFIIFLLVDLIRFANIQMVFSASGNGATIFWIALGSLAINIALAIPLYHAIGMMGPALATLLSMLLSYIVSFRFGSKILATNLYAVFNIRKLMYILIEICAMIMFWQLAKSYVECIDPILRFFLFYPILLMLLVAFNKKVLLYYYKSLNNI